MNILTTNIHFFNQGDIDEISGGYLYNKYLLFYLEQSGQNVFYHNTPQVIDEEDVMIVDSLMLSTMKEQIETRHQKTYGLIHMPIEYGQEFPKSYLKELYQSLFLVTTGKKCYDYLKTTYQIPEDQITLIEPGIQPVPQMKIIYPVFPKKLICIANLVNGKGFEMLLGVLNNLKTLNWNLEIYGNEDLDPGYTMQIKKRIADLQLGHKIKLNGVVAHQAIFDKMASSDLLLNFSKYETYSMVIAEAISVGLPVLAFRTGNWEIFEKSGLVVYQKDYIAADFEKTLKLLLTNREIYKKLRLNHNVTSTRTWEKVGAEFLNVINRMVP